MALRKLLRHGFPVLPERPPSSHDVFEQVMALPMIAPLRLFADNIVVLRPWWPLLLPLMLWVGWRAYRRERVALLERAGD